MIEYDEARDRVSKLTDEQKKQVVDIIIDSTISVAKVVKIVFPEKDMLEIVLGMENNDYEIVTLIDAIMSDEDKSIGLYDTEQLVQLILDKIRK